jgi:nitrous oxide reductase accessory protein NosL
MFVAKYEKLIATIKTEKESFYFDGVKDMMKFYFEPTKYIKNADLKNSTIKVTDYYTLEQIDAKNAFFVIGSNVMGPMGDELIPFKDENSANEFSKDHFGKKIVKFNEITLDTIPKKHH